MRYEKLGPGLLTILDEVRSDGREVLARRMMTAGLVEPSTRVSEERYIVFVRCNETVDLAGLIVSGVQTNQARGSIRTAIATRSGIGELSDHPEVHRITATRTLRPLMDIAGPFVQLSAFVNRTGASGTGVVIGVVDTGIDAGHSAFAHRIHSIWDQTLPGPGVAQGGYGFELQGPTLSISRDTVGHGTHVAGIAAGAAAPFAGVAPAATLVIVKSTLNTGHIADGIDYIFDTAQALGLPAVINLSLGAHWDAHDGSDDLSALIDSRSGPGRIVVAAAGNEGNDNIHASATLDPGQLGSMRFHVPRGVMGATLNIWYPGNAALSLSLRSPSGLLTPTQGQSASPATHVFSLPDATIRMTTPNLPDPGNQDFQALVELSGPSPGAAIATGIWQLRLENTSANPARVDAWSIDDRGGTLVMFSGTSIDDSTKIGSPGCAATAITVASHTTRDRWIDAGNIPRQVGLGVGAISDFSSEGPLRPRAGVQQGLKPDVAAPGAVIVAPLSAASAPEAAWIVQNSPNGFRANLGTSMAAPFVAGVVALLLEQNPSLTPAQVRQRLVAASAQAQHDVKTGFGLIDCSRL